VGFFPEMQGATKKGDTYEKMTAMSRVPMRSSLRNDARSCGSEVALGDIGEGYDGGKWPVRFLCFILFQVLDASPRMMLAPHLAGACPALTFDDCAFPGNNP